MSDVCDQYFSSQMGLLGIYCVIGSAQIIVSILSLKQISIIHKQKHFPPLLLFSQWLFYISSILFAIAQISTSIFLCFLYKYYAISYAMMGVAYAIHWGAILLVLLTRLKLVFDDTNYKFGQKKTFFCWFIFILIFCISVLINTMLTLQITPEIINLMIGSLVFIVLVVANFLAFTFVMKLHKLRQESNLDFQNNKQLFMTTRKYAVLSLISVLFSTFYAIILIIISVAGIKWSYYLVISLHICIVLDVFLDTICMTLSLAINEKYYKKLCFISAINHYICFNDETKEVKIVIEGNINKSNACLDVPNVNLNTDSEMTNYSVAHAVGSLADIVADTESVRNIHDHSKPVGRVLSYSNVSAYTSINIPATPSQLTIVEKSNSPRSINSV